MNRELSLDFETTSAADLRRVGAYKYSLDASTKVLVLRYFFDGGKIIGEWRIGDNLPGEIAAHVNCGLPVTAWNASFKFHIWNNCFMKLHQFRGYMPPLKLEQLHDTMAAAAYWGLPLSLDQAAPATGLSVVKDKAGHRLMMQMAKPRKRDPKGRNHTWWHEDEPSKLDALSAYCAQDVRTECAVAQAIRLLPAAERDIWLMDMRTNLRGVGLDMKLIDKLQALADEATKAANLKIQALTDYLRNNTMYPNDNLRKDVVAERLANPACIGHERELLELRASTAKLRAMKDAAVLDQKTGGVFSLRDASTLRRVSYWPLGGTTCPDAKPPEGLFQAGSCGHYYYSH